MMFINIGMTNIPFESITKFGQITMINQPLFSVSWILGRFCNYKCSYCWPYARSDMQDYQTLEVYKNSVDSIKQQAKSNGFSQFHWSFSGGEPTAYKDLVLLISHLDDLSDYQSLHMTTNLSPGKLFWDKWINNSNFMNRRSITASFHSEFANEDEFIDKILFLMDHNIYVTVNQVMVPDQFFNLYERCNRMYKKGINVTLKPQSNTTASNIVEGYTDEMMLIMQTGFPQHNKEELVHQIVLYDLTTEYKFDQAERFNAFGFNKFKDWQCNSGYQSVIIRSNEVKRSYSCHDEILGTLTQGFTLFNKPKVCITPTCISSADSKIPKCII